MSSRLHASGFRHGRAAWMLCLALQTLFLPLCPGQARATKPASLEVADPIVSPEVKPYLAVVERKVRKKWSIPENAELRKGSVAVELLIDKDGTLRYAKVLSSSGDRDLDGAALAAISAARPFPALPESIKADHVTLQLHLNYNAMPDESSQ
jgi:TonB family protein